MSSGELDGVVVYGIFRVSGWTSFTLKASAAEVSPRCPARSEQPLQPRWIRERLQARRPAAPISTHADLIATAPWAIVSMDEGRETRAGFEGAYITQVSIPTSTRP
jgi:hypothetical protein